MCKRSFRERRRGSHYPKRPGHPSGKGEYVCPVVRLKKALQGHPDSGGFWEDHCNRVLKQAGFEPIRAWPSTYFHKKLECMLSVCVDDFKMAGPASNLAEGWSLIGKHIQIESPTAPGHFLGCTHEIFEAEIPVPSEVRERESGRASSKRQEEQHANESRA